jgi:hypothetical protein
MQSQNIFMSTTKENIRNKRESLTVRKIWVLKRGVISDNGHFDNLDNGFLNKFDKKY